MKKILLTIAVAAYMAVMFAFFIISAKSLGLIYEKGGIIDDNILHILTFFVFTFLLALALKAYLVKKPILLAITGSILVAIIIEIMQMFIPTRHAMAIDLGLHTIGTLAYAAVHIFMSKIYKILHK